MTKRGGLGRSSTLLFSLLVSGSVSASASVLSGCSADHQRAPPLAASSKPVVPTDRIPPHTGAFTATPCPVTPPDEYAVECGTVTVPAHHDSPSADMVQLAVAVVYSNGSNVAKAPVVFLDGGPGAASIEALFADKIPFDAVLEDHDLVLFDQRGTGFSRPKPSCDAPSEIVSLPDPSGGSADAGADAGTTTNDVLGVLVTCRKQATLDGIDLSIFRSSENAADVTSVRQALGYGAWNLYGISYGTRYALATLRDQPGGTTSVILDSVVPPQVDLLADEGVSIYASLHAVSSACLAQSDCDLTFGDVESKQLEILERLDRTPAEVVGSDGSSTEVSATLAASLFTTLLYSGTAIPYVPEIVQEIYDADYSLFEQASTGGDSVIDEATYLSVICAEEAPFSSAAALAERSQAIPEAWRPWVAPERIFDACAIWDVPAAPALENEAVTNSTPTLVLSGDFDPVTPPAYGALAARTLSSSQFITLSDQAHASSISTCGKTLIHAFLQNPLGKVSAGCASAPAPVFKGRGGFSVPVTEGTLPSLRFVTTRQRPPAEVLKDAMFRASRLRPPARTWRK